MLEREINPNIKYLNDKSDVDLLIAHGLIDIMLAIGESLEEVQTPFEEACIYLREKKRNQLEDLIERDTVVFQKLECRDELTIFLDQQQSDTPIPAKREWQERLAKYLEYEKCLEYFAAQATAAIPNMRNIDKYSLYAGREQMIVVNNFAAQIAQFTTEYAQERQNLAA